MIKKLPYVLIFLIVVGLISLPFFIKVKVECKSQFGECPAEVNASLQTLNSKNLFLAKSKAVSFLKKDFLVSDFSIQFKLPDVLLINIIVKKPYYALKDNNSGKFELVDAKGTVIAISSGSGLPTVSTSEQQYKIGETVTASDLFALKLVSGVYQMYQVGYGTISNDALVVDITHGLRVIFPLEGDSEVLLGALRLIYTKVTTSYSGIYSQVDMRYKNPVLR